MKGIGNPYEASVKDILQNPGLIKKIASTMSGNARNVFDTDVKSTYKLIEKGYIQTMQELEAWSFQGALPGMTKDLTSQTTGYTNTIYGRTSWDQVNREATLFSLLPKKVWDKSGWRVVKDEDVDLAKYMTEGGSIPAGEDPSVGTLSMRPADIVIRNKRSDILDALALVDDGIGIEFLSSWLSKRHKQLINLELLAENGVASTSAIHLIPIDRIIAENSEIAYGLADNSNVLPAGSIDVYSEDRDTAAGWTDAQVSGQAYGSTDRPLTIDMLDNIIDDIRIAGGVYDNNNIIVTHPETATRIDQLLRSQQRFDEVRGLTYLKGGSAGAQDLGAEPREGVEGGFQVKTYRGIPIYEDKNVVQDVSLGRIYILNLNHLFMAMLMPTKFYKWSGPEATSAFDINMLYRTVGQVVCTNFRKQGKIRDLSA